MAEILGLHFIRVNSSLSISHRSGAMADPRRDNGASPIVIQGVNTLRQSMVRTGVNILMVSLQSVADNGFSPPKAV